MIDMKTFTLTQHDDELEAIIKTVAQNSREHRLLAQWAVDCVQRFLPLFQEKYPQETSILHQAISILEQWMAESIPMWEARKYTYTVLALARTLEQKDKPYVQIVRAASHCLATCHVPTHSEATAMYLVSAIKQIHRGAPDVLLQMENERKWQIAQLHQRMNT